jgi:hypothetical protein
MLHARKDYNRIQDPDNKIPEDEPVFLLRAQDQVAAEAVRHWAVLHRYKGGNVDIAMMAEKQADLMDKWPKHKPADL